MIQLSLCLIKCHAMPMCEGVEVWIHIFLTSAKDGGEWSASCPSRFTPRGLAPGTKWMVRQVGHRAILYAVKKRQISCPTEN
jgi:hypothetical protein